MVNERCFHHLTGVVSAQVDMQEPRLSNENDVQISVSERLMNELREEASQSRQCGRTAPRIQSDDAMTERSYAINRDMKRGRSPPSART